MSRLAHVRLVAINDVYELTNLPKLQAFLSKLSPSPAAVVLAGDFLSPSPLSSIDGGRGMVSTLRAVGLTHCSFGNHEAGLETWVSTRTSERIVQICQSFEFKHETSSPKAGWLGSSETKSYDIVQSPCRQVKVALIGLFGDHAWYDSRWNFQGGADRQYARSI
jgi:2',3'-cyclic-nucleotide 2'-phosphodiesterase (5'-nucleotidase family)